MKLLAFDTSTETLSIALAPGPGRAVRTHRGAAGPQASATLVPAILQLLADEGLAVAQLDAIVFGRGPGSFTGLRTACAVAQGLGFGSGVPVVAADTLLAVAEQARRTHGSTRVVTVLDARMDEVYGAAYAFDEGGWRTEEAPWLDRPEAVRVPEGFDLAGNAFGAYGERLPARGRRIHALPDAEALLGVAPALIAAGAARPAAEALPLYVRDKVADTTAERAARAASTTP